MHESEARGASRISFGATLTENVQEANVSLFTDDTNLLVTRRDECDLQHKIIINVMREVETWFQNNNLIINIEKNIYVISSKQTSFFKTTNNF
jgi:hypothetical protein